MAFRELPLDQGLTRFGISGPRFLGLDAKEHRVAAQGQQAPPGQRVQEVEIEGEDPAKTLSNEIGTLNFTKTVYDFLESCPFNADEYTSEWHNVYHNTVDKHHTNSYLNLVLETHLDADQSGGTFLTEKTFKPIKHSQLFLIVGPPGSVAQLRKMGYKTFDTWIDHGYDSIENNTQRWDAVMKEFERLCASDLHRIYIDCCASIEHNQRLFLSDKSARLNTLLQKVQHEQS